VVAAAVSGALERALQDGWDPRLGLDAIFAVVRAANQHVEDTKPWTMARAEDAGDDDARQGLDTVLAELVEALRLVAEALRPFLPTAAERLGAQLGVTLSATWSSSLRWGAGSGGQLVGASRPLFPSREREPTTAV